MIFCEKAILKSSFLSIGDGGQWYFYFLARKKNAGFVFFD
jgi:hypothetical protein